MSLCDKRVGFFPSPNNWDIFRAPRHGLREPQLELRFEEAVKSNNSAPRLQLTSESSRNEYLRRYAAITG